MRRLEIQSGMAGRWAGLVISTLRSAGPAAILLVGSVLVIHHAVTLGTLVGFAVVGAVGFGIGLQGFASALLSTAETLADVAADLRSSRRAIRCHRRTHRSSDGPGARRGGVRGSHLRLPVRTTRPALCDITLRVQPGQMVALVGPSGAGKTTLSNLVARFYDPQEGRVTIDGNDLRDVTLASVSSAVGLVLQDTFLFHATIRENLLVRPARRHRVRTRPRGARRRTRSGHRRSARGLRHRHRGPRSPTERRRAAAGRHRPGDPQGPGDPDPRRGDLPPRFDLGRSHPEGAGVFVRGSNRSW